MSTERILLIIAVFLASLSLVRLMRKRQSHLTGLLRQHVDRQKEWAQKRARAASMAVQAAKSKEKSPEQEAADIAELLNATQDVNASPQPSNSTQPQNASAT